MHESETVCVHVHYRRTLPKAAFMVGGWRRYGAVGAYMSFRVVRNLLAP